MTTLTEHVQVAMQRSRAAQDTLQAAAAIYSRPERFGRSLTAWAGGVLDSRCPQPTPLAIRFAERCG